MPRPKKLSVILAKNLPIVFGLVLIWRGTWYTLDWADLQLFGGSHILSSILGIVIGLALLYYPDHDLKEIEKL